MKVTGTGTTSSIGAPRRTGRTDRRSDDFARHLENAVDGLADQQPIDGLAPLSAVEALLAAQSVGDATDEESRRRMLKRGEDLLDRLAELRVDLLEGRVSKDRLLQLADLVRGRRESVSDPQLSALLDEIDLRAQVELAKFGQD